MALLYKTPSEVAEDYLIALKALKPEINKDQTDSDWYIRSRVVGGVLSGIYGDQRKISDDPFPQSARREALEKHLNTLFDEGFKAATPAVGNVIVTGTIGSTVPILTEFTHSSTGNTYQATAAVTLTGTSGLVAVQSISTGQSQNLLSGSILTLSSPPSGINSSATASGNLSDGTDIESDDRAKTRILEQIRTPLAGGKVSDYVKFALAADPSVVSANILRFPYGFGTVAVIITAGTTDIDQALDNDQAIVVTPSPALVTAVQDYIDTQKPITDCVSVSAPVEVPVNVSVKVRYKSGTNSTILLGQTLTQQQLVQREVKRAIFKTPPGGRVLGGAGYVVGSEIEEVIDSNLSDEPYTLGNKAQILLERQVADLGGTGIPNFALLGNQVAVPGTITVTEY